MTLAKGDPVSVILACSAGKNGVELEFGHVVSGKISMRDPEGLGTSPEPHIYLDLGLAGKGWFRTSQVRKEICE